MFESFAWQSATFLGCSLSVYIHAGRVGMMNSLFHPVAEDFFDKAVEMAIDAVETVVFESRFNDEV